MSGNGKDEIKITVTEVGDGYAAFTIGEHAPGLDATKALSQCVTDWFREKGPKVVLSSLPIVRDGTTFAIHVWFVERGELDD